MFRHFVVTPNTTQPHVAKFFLIWLTIAGYDELCMEF